MNRFKHLFKNEEDDIPKIDNFIPEWVQRVLLETIKFNPQLKSKDINELQKSLLLLDKLDFRAYNIHNCGYENIDIG